MCLTEYWDDVAAGFITEKLYYVLHSNPEQYGRFKQYWFEDGNPNMLAFRREFRKFRPCDIANPNIEPGWFWLREIRILNVFVARKKRPTESGHGQWRA